MPDENSLAGERELCTPESLLPYCSTTSAKLIISTMIAPTNAIIESCRLDEKLFRIILWTGE
jgi:hypothetical protein